METGYHEAAMEADNQRTMSGSWVQIFRYQDVDPDGMMIDGFIAGAVYVEGGELFRIHGCG